MFSGKITFRRLRWVALLTIAVSLATNLTLRAIGVSLFDPSSVFRPLSVGPVIFWTVVTALGAVIVFGIVGRFARNPAPWFIIIAFTVYLLTFSPDTLLLFATPPPFPNTTIYTVGTLLSMHVVEAALTISLLITLGFERAQHDNRKSQKETGRRLSS